MKGARPERLAPVVRPSVADVLALPFVEGAGRPMPVTDRRASAAANHPAVAMLTHVERPVAFEQRRGSDAQVALSAADSEKRQRHPQEQSHDAEAMR